MSVYRDPNLIILFGATIASVLGVSGVTPAFPKVIRALDISSQQVGLLITAYTLPGVVLTPFVGAIADRVGRKRVLVGSLLLFGIAGTVCALVRDFQGLLGLRVVQGVGGAPVVALNIALIGDLFDGAKRTAAVGYNSAALNLGTASYPALGGALATFAWYAPFALPVIAVPMAGLVWRYLDVPEQGTGDAAPQWADLWDVLRQPIILGLLTASACAFFLFFAYLTYLPEYISEQFTEQSFVIGLVVASASIANALAASQLGRLTRLFSKMAIVVALFAVAIVALGSIPLLPSLYLIPLAAFAFGGGLGAGVTAILDVLSEQAPPKHRATVLSINSTAIRIGQTLGPLAMGAVVTWGGAGMAFYACSALAVLFAACIGRVVWDGVVWA